MATWKGRALSGLRAVGDVVVGGPTVAAAVLVSPLIRDWYNRYGATDAEVASEMPGDELVLEPKLGFTRAITIDSSPAEVWPWLAQIGQGRGGLYSYDGLENLVGCRIHSASEILPDHQRLEVGYLVRSGPDHFPCWMVMACEPNDHVVLLGAGTPAEVSVPEIVGAVPETGYTASTWQWVLRSADGGRRTRLVVRQRLTYSPEQKRVWRVFEPINFVMERRMLKGIRSRAERAVAS